MTASLTYDSFMSNVLGNSPAMVPASDTMFLMLVNGGTPSKTADTTRASVTNETTGTGYSAGGQAATITTSLNTGTNTESISLSNVVWGGSNTFSATGGVLYKHNGGVASGDPLMCYIDFGGTVSCVAGTFTVSQSSALTITNP